MTWVGHEAGIVVFLGILVVISAINLVGMRRLRHAPQHTSEPAARVSILVPARNEEAKIGSCIASLLAQEYPDFEVLVLDDNSSDHTADRVLAIGPHPRLRLLRGTRLPSGWLGKNWACHQLSEAADGELLLFVDADTRHHPRTLSDAVACLERDRVDFLSVLPEQELRTWGERLIVPLLAWSQQTFHPVPVFRRARLPILTTAVGQFMLFRRSAYDVVGGFAAIRASPIDDCDLVRAVARTGLRWTLLDGTGRVAARMYGSLREAASGFARNLYARFGFNLPLFAFVWAWLVWVTWEPLAVLLLRAIAPRSVSPELAAYAGAAAGLGFLLWLVSDLRFRVRLDHVALSPLTVAAAAGIAARSVLWRLLRRGTWKSRPLRP